MSETESVSLFIDTVNLGYFSTQPVDYLKLIREGPKHLLGHDNWQIDRAIAYVCVKDDGFKKMLKSFGYTVCNKHLFKRRACGQEYYAPDCNVEIVLDVVDSEADHVIVGSNSKMLTPMFRRFDSYLVGCVLPNELRKLSKGHLELSKEWQR